MASWSSGSRTRRTWGRGRSSASSIRIAGDGLSSSDPGPSSRAPSSKASCGGPCARLNPGVSVVNPGSLFGEFRRRRVFRALIGYGIASFAVLQIIEPIMHGLHWPEEVLSYVVVALALGFPVVVALAWIFDVKAGRIERTPAGPLRGSRAGLLIAGIGLLAAAPGLVWYFMLHRTQAASAPGPSIAVLPLVNLSSDKE